jgi:hypothetical protein
MEGARVRFQAAASGWFVIDGGSFDYEVARELVTVVIAGTPLVLRLATVAQPWTGISGVVVDQSTSSKLVGKTQRLLVDLSQIVGMKITD